MTVTGSLELRSGLAARDRRVVDEARGAAPDAPLQALGVRGRGPSQPVAARAEEQGLCHLDQYQVDGDHPRQQRTPVTVIIGRPMPLQGQPTRRRLRCRAGRVPGRRDAWR